MKISGWSTRQPPAIHIINRSVVVITPRVSSGLATGVVLGACLCVYVCEQERKSIAGYWEWIERERERGTARSCHLLNYSPMSVYVCSQHTHRQPGHIAPRLRVVIIRRGCSGGSSRFHAQPRDYAASLYLWMLSIQTQTPFVWLYLWCG